jgi:hypothetical protein
MARRRALKRYLMTLAVNVSNYYNGYGFAIYAGQLARVNEREGK